MNARTRSVAWGALLFSMPYSLLAADRAAPVGCIALGPVCVSLLFQALARSSDELGVSARKALVRTGIISSLLSLAFQCALLVMERLHVPLEVLGLPAQAIYAVFFVLMCLAFIGWSVYGGFDVYKSHARPSVFFRLSRTMCVYTGFVVTALLSNAMSLHAFPLEAVSAMAFLFWLVVLRRLYPWQLRLDTDLLLRTRLLFLLVWNLSLGVPLAFGQQGLSFGSGLGGLIFVPYLIWLAGAAFAAAGPGPTAVQGPGAQESGSGRPASSALGSYALPGLLTALLLLVVIACGIVAVSGRGDAYRLSMALSLALAAACVIFDGAVVGERNPSARPLRSTLVLCASVGFLSSAIVEYGPFSEAPPVLVLFLIASAMLSLYALSTCEDVFAVTSLMPSMFAITLSLFPVFVIEVGYEQIAWFAPVLSCISASVVLSTRRSSQDNSIRHNAEKPSAGLSLGLLPAAESESMSNASSPAASKREHMLALLGEHDIYGLQARVLIMVSEGYSNSRIARELCASPNTVKSYRSRGYKKLNLHSAEDLREFLLK